MKLLDLLVLIPLLYGGVSGYKKGLLIEIIGIAAFFAAMVIGFKFLGLSMEILSPYITAELARRILPFIGFAAIYFPTVFLINQFGYFLRKSLRYTLLGTFDNVAGASVGTFTWVFGTSVFFWLLNTMGVRIPEHRTDDTYLYPLIAPIAPKVISAAMDWYPRGSQLILDWKKEYLEPDITATENHGEMDNPE